MRRLTLFDASVAAVEKKLQGNIPAKTIRAQGAFRSEGN